MKKDLITMFNGPKGISAGERVLDNLLQIMTNAMDEQNFESALFSNQPKNSLPKINVKETDDSYLVDIAVAGFAKEDVSLEIKDNCFFIKCEHNEETNEDNHKYVLKEISNRSFKRVLRFPKKIDVDSISCDYKNGIVSCSVGKQAVKPDSTIKIKIN